MQTKRRKRQYKTGIQSSIFVSITALLISACLAAIIQFNLIIMISVSVYDCPEREIQSQSVGNMSLLPSK